MKAFTAHGLIRATAPRRVWLAWAIAILAACVLAWTFWSWVERGGYALWIGADVPLLPSFLLILWVLPPILILLPGALAPTLLHNDLEAGRLEPLLLTTADRLPMLAAYRRRAVLTSALVLALFVPFWAPAGRGPAVLLPVSDMLEILSRPSCWWPSLWWSVQASASGLLSDLATIWLSASLGLLAGTVIRRRAWALAASLISTSVFVVLAWQLGALLVGLLVKLGVRWSEMGPYVYTDPVEPGYSLLCWGFAMPYSLAAWALGRFALRYAARIIDRRLTD